MVWNNGLLKRKQTVDHSFSAYPYSSTDWASDALSVTETLATTSASATTTAVVTTAKMNNSITDTRNTSSRQQWRRNNSKKECSKSLPPSMYAQQQRRSSWLQRSKEKSSKSFSTLFSRNKSQKNQQPEQQQDPVSQQQQQLQENNRSSSRFGSFLSRRRRSSRRNSSLFFMAPQPSTLLLPEDDQTIEFVPASTVPTKNKSAFPPTQEASTTSPETTTTATTPSYQLSERDIYDFVWEYMESFTKVAQEVSSNSSAVTATEEDDGRDDNDEPSTISWNHFWKTYHTPDYLLIRPSGNSLDMGGYRKLFESGQITNFSEQVMAVESIKLLGNHIACVVFKTEQSYKKEGELLEDFLTWSAVMVQDASTGQVQITNIHRSAGRSIMDPCISSAQ